MSPNNEGRLRQSLRLKNYNYTWAGAYFVTIVAQNRACRFGVIEHDTMILNQAGAMLQEQWAKLPTRFPSIDLDAFVLMPNHVHGIIIFPTSLPTTAAQITSTATTQRGDPAATSTENSALGTIIGAWKSLTRVSYITGIKERGWKPFAGRLWQRNYYEHIVRNEEDLARIRYYIECNPKLWAEDAENPQHVPSTRQ